MQETQLYLSPLETQLNCTAGDVFRNAFTKKEDEEQSYYDHGHVYDNDHGEQDEEEDDPLGD